ncbi:MAG: MarR family transcriptional regulator [Bacteroidia bacterium]|nr:MarR family transcriptional regulator [Bacteroidia bacterium]
MHCFLFDHLLALGMDQFQQIAESMVVYKLRSAWHEIARLYNEISQDHGATLSMGFILLTLNEEEGTPVTKIAPRMGMEPNSLSRVLNSMEQDGLVFRKRDSEDKRKVFICMTEHGVKMREIAIKAVFRLNNAIVKSLSEPQLKAFFEVMDQIPLAIESVKERMKEE